MKASIVVATNRGDFWQRFCDALSKNDAELEVIFVGPVNNGAKDLPVPTRFINITDPTIGAARCWEIGARAATGELLGLAPDDVIFTSGILDAVAKEAAYLHHPYDTFTAKYFCNDKDESAAQHIWSIGTMPLLPIGGFSFTEGHHKIGGIDKRFHGVYWDTDLYMHMHQLGGRTTLLDGHVCHEQNQSHGLYGQNQVADGKVLQQLWPAPLTPKSQRADSQRRSWEDCEGMSSLCQSNPHLRKLSDAELAEQIAERVESNCAVER